MNFYKTIEANTDQMVSDISTLIKYKSIQGEAEDGMPYGKEMDDALNCVLDLAEKMGFRTKKLVILRICRVWGKRYIHRHFLTR